MKASLFYKCGCFLGEGVMWHNARQSFFWVDIEGKTIYECRWSDKKVTTKNLSSRVSLILETEDVNKLLLGVQGGLMFLDLDTGQSKWLCEIDKEIKDNRTNDGGYDPKKRIWVGTMNINCDRYAGALYCLDEHGSLVKKVERMSIPNGIAWTRDAKTMYHVESEDRVVNAYDYDVDNGAIVFNRVAISVPGDLGSPDGMCMDNEGMLWIAHWGGFGVYRWNPVSGQMIDKIDVAVPNVSACSFGGLDNNVMLITTARQAMSQEDLLKYPESGDVFCVEF
jgi:sugar lactone lactonase YvrE